LRARRKPNYDAVCFHAQQGSEKYLKAWLQEFTIIIIPRTHNLVELFNLCLENDQSFVLAAEDLGELDTYAVAIRYPGNKANQTGAARALIIALSLQKNIRNQLGH
jgi:HEPN domain-containing protein